MTVSVKSSAPGKLILIGEYAVLEGWPAVVTAVEPRAQVRLEPSPDGSWKFSAPGVAEAPAECSVGSRGKMSWQGGDRTAGESFVLVERLMRGMAEVGLVDPAVLSPAAAVLDTSALFQERRKLGLGSSAALTVALASALRTWADGEIKSDAAWLQALVDLHRGVQGGRGSGIDVAASLLGGVLRFQLDSPAGGPEKTAGRVRAAEPVALPQDLKILIAWTGRSASTEGFLQQLEVRTREEPRAVKAALARLGSVSAEGVGALQGAHATGFLRAVEAFWSGLEELERVFGVPVLSEPHRRLQKLAVSCGGVYKPSGAGGGDLGVAFTTDPEVEFAMRRRFSAAGFACLNLGFGRTVPPAAVERL